MNTWTLINYFDVWGNAKDGWDVNDVYIECRDLVIADDWKPKDILNYLKRCGYIATSDLRRIVVEDLGDRIEICQRKGMCPLYGLARNI